MIAPKNEKLFFQKFTHFFDEPGHAWIVNVGRSGWNKRTLNPYEFNRLQARLKMLGCNSRAVTFGDNMRSIVFDNDSDNALFIFFVNGGLIK